ncbi:gluconate 2-dehydrogenase subunit 3 family protein [Conexibacter sp. CPCC 206217]|uniref:gluconate 2-dehydrogenase subunit 3 family protein n=1 Tax=Conexibacter sp. CPCC 206217 TaxID=3064574 RepID=UPI002729034D|nr:gluconate 2-dehydrogenase subunit 3 family protein [Conexibacter sp. CPCC 206217]MDO8213547.1 gluconate 2-dehydrogenase subunit 3 family protein [Conexibacter sp. CPCC 206217]
MAVDAQGVLLALTVLTCLNHREAATVDALAGRILPGDEHDPGAREAGAVVYVDRALTGAYANLRELYRRGCEELDAFAIERSDAPFAKLSETQQDELLTVLCDPLAAQRPQAATGDARQARLAYFFAVVREHVIQGTFCDPVYGGNRDGLGWRLLGFPGAYWGYGEGQHGTYGFDALDLPVKTLADLRREHAERGQEHAR